MGRGFVPPLDSPGDTRMLGNATLVYVRDEGTVRVSTLSLALTNVFF